MSYDRKTTRKLCGGTLLTILLHYKRQAVKSEVQVLGKKTNLRQVDFIRDLLRIMRPNHSPYNDGTFAYQGSRYKNCKINGEVTFLSMTGITFPVTPAVSMKSFSV